MRKIVLFFPNFLVSIICENGLIFQCKENAWTHLLEIVRLLVLLELSKQKTLFLWSIKHLVKLTDQKILQDFTLFYHELDFTLLSVFYIILSVIIKVEFQTLLRSTSATTSTCKFYANTSKLCVIKFKYLNIFNVLDLIYPFTVWIWILELNKEELLGK